MINADLNDVKNNLAHLIINNIYENILSPNDKEYHLIYIMTFLLKHEINNLNNDYCNPDNFLFDSLCGILFDEFYLKEQLQSFYKIIFLDLIETSESKYSSQDFIFNNDQKNDIRQSVMNDNNQNNNNLLFVKKYMSNLTEDELMSKMDEFDNKEMKDYIDRNLIICLEEGKQDIYTNSKFLINFNSDNFNIYCDNFFSAINLIDKFIVNISQHLNKLPYSIKCICKIIKILIKKKYAAASLIEQNSFISKFFYDKLLVPFFKNSNLFALLNQYITLNNTIKNFLVLKDIISKLLNATFFRSDNDLEVNYTPFNVYFIEKMPEIINLFEKITDVKIPEFSNKIINEEIENNEFNFFEDNIEDNFFYCNICFSFDQLFALIDTLNKNKDKILKNKDDENVIIIQKSIEKVTSSNDYKKLKKYNDFKISAKNEIIVAKNYIKEEVKEIEYFYIISDLLVKKKIKTQLEISSNKKDYFYTKELKEVKNDEEKAKNDDIKIKNLICSVLYYIDDIKCNDFSTKNSNIINILREFKKYINSDCINYDFVPSEWYINSLINFIQMHQIKTNNFEFILTKLESEIMTSINKFDFCQLGQISKTIDNMKKYKLYYKKAKQLAVEIDLNIKAQQVISNEEIPVILIYDNERIILEEYKNKKKIKSYLHYSICNTIEYFINEFPDLTTNEDVFQKIANFNVCRLINEYCKIIDKHIKKMKMILNEKELIDINNKIYDYIMEKLYLKLFPKAPSEIDNKIYEKTSKLQWIEIQNLIKNNYNYDVDEILPNVTHSFDRLDKEKSPRKKTLCIEQIFLSINQFGTFINDKGDGGVNFSLPILIYALIKAKPKKIDSICQYMQLFLENEDIFLTQLVAASNKVQNFSIEDVYGVTESDYYENCHLSELNILH